MLCNQMGSNCLLIFNREKHGFEMHLKKALLQRKREFSKGMLSSYNFWVKAMEMTFLCV